MDKLFDIDPQEARHVLYAFGADGGYQGGNFTSKVIDAALVADMDNLEKLSQGFPGLIAAIRLGKYQSNGIAVLQHIANGDTE